MMQEILTAQASWNSIPTLVKKKHHQICSCVVLTATVLFSVHLRMKATLSPILIKGSCSHRAPRWFGFIQSRPWLFDWTHWLKGNFNDLLSQVLIRCWQTALCGTGQGWGPEWTELAGLLPLGWVKGWAAHRVQTHRSTSFPLEHSLCTAVTSSLVRPGRLWLRCFGAFFFFLTRSFSLALSSLVTVLPPFELALNERERSWYIKMEVRACSRCVLISFCIYGI